MVLGSMRSIVPAGKDASKKTEKRDYILECARRVFANRGVTGATMQEIAAAAGVSKGALYLLFESKDALYYQLVATVIDELVVCMRQAASIGGTGLERTRGLLLAYARYYAEDVTRFRLALGWMAPDYQPNDSLPSAVAYRSNVVEMMGMIMAAIEEGQRDGSIRPELNARDTVFICWGGLLGMLCMNARATDSGPLPPQADAAIWTAQARNIDRAAPDARALIEGYVERITSTLCP